jgi:hypothetical protein
MDATEAALDSPLKGCEWNAASILKVWRKFDHQRLWHIALGSEHP